MIDFSDFATEIFQILRAYCQDIVLYDEDGARVYEPTEARRMYVLGDNILISIKEDGDNSALKLFLSPTIGLGQLKGFIETLRNMAAKSNLLFHVKRFNKEIKPQDFATKASLNEQENLNMNLMEGMYGTSKSSYLKLENARMIVRHKERIKENMIGSRGRHIQSIFVENAQGERFLFPVNILSGARAMTQHVNQGGTFADEVGQQIIRMAQDFRNLAQVASRETVIDAERFGGLRESIVAAMKGQKRVFARLGESKYYARECERVLESANLMEGDDTITAKVADISAILGEGVEQEQLLSVARLVDLSEMAEPMIEEIGDDDEEPMPGMGDDGEGNYENDEDFQHSDAGSVKEENELMAPDNSVVKKFDEWMDEFEPENILGERRDPRAIYNAGEECAKRGGKRSENPHDRLGNPVDFDLWNTGYKDAKKFMPKAAKPVAQESLGEGIIDQASDEFEADEDWVYDNQDAIANELQSLVDQCESNPSAFATLGRKIQKGIRLMRMAGYEPEDMGIDMDGVVANRLGLNNLDEQQLDEFELNGKRPIKDRAEWAAAVKGIAGAKVDMNSATRDGKVVAKWINDQAGGWVADGTVKYEKTSIDDAKSHLDKAGAFDFERQMKEGEDEELDEYVLDGIDDTEPATDEDETDMNNELNEYRRKASDMDPDAAPAPNYEELRNTIHAADIKLRSMSPFDPEYASVRAAKDEAEQKLKGMHRYGKSGLGEEALTEGDDDHDLDSMALYYTLGEYIPGADTYTMTQADTGELGIAIEDGGVDSAEFEANYKQKLIAAFASFGITITDITYGGPDESGWCEIKYTGKVNRAALNAAHGEDLVRYYEDNAEAHGLDFMEYFADNEGQHGSVGEIIDRVMTSMLGNRYGGYGTKRGYLYISTGLVNPEMADKIEKVLNKALASEAVSIAYDHRTGDGFAYEIYGDESLFEGGVIPSHQGDDLKREVGQEADDGQLQRMRQLAGLR